MKIRWLAVVLLSGISVCVIASEWAFTYRPATASYAIYGNSLGDPMPPSGEDNKIAFEIRGPAAQEIFSSIGPDQKDLCSSETGTRFRSRDEEKIVCTKSEKGEYACYFGFDLRSGKSIGGSIC